MAVPVAAGDGLPIYDEVPESDEIDVEVDVVAPMTADGSVLEDADGGVVVDFSPPQNPATSPEALLHGANLAEYMPETALNSLSEQLMAAVDQDKESRADWESMMTEGIRYLGLKFEDRTYPFPGASGVFDTLMLEAVIRWHATATAELLPASGPVKTQIIGIPDERTEAQASRVKEFMNYYLTEGAPEYVEENDQMLMWLPLMGSTFKKTYQDPILNRPVSTFVSANNLIVNYGATDIDTAPRVTHVFKLTLKELKMRQITGFYRDVELGAPGELNPSETSDAISEKVDEVQGTQRIDSENPDMGTNYEFREIHVDIDLEGFEHKSAIEGDEGGEPTGLPLPYIITIEVNSRKVMSIRRNWREGDATYEKIQYFTHFKFVPGLGFYGIGYAHILGNPAKAATALQRQMIDAATLEMFPGGLRVKGMRLGENNKMIAPCEFIEIDTGGLPINQAVSPMPYKGPSDVSLVLWEKGRENAMRLAGGSEIAVGEGRQDAPVGTTVALLEAANRAQSSTLKNCHRSFRREFKLIAALFGQYLPDLPYPFPVAGGEKAIMRADFSNNIDVIPVSDPNITSSAQRMMRAEALLRMATQAPNLHNQYEAYKQMYVEMGVDPGKIERLLPPPQEAVPLDPLTENQNALIGKPLKAAVWQDHNAHIMSHQPLAENVPSMQAHIAEHMALQMRVNVEKQLGIQLPPETAQLPPEIQNQIAVLVSQAIQQLNAPKADNPTPEQIMMEDLRVKALGVQKKWQETLAKQQGEAYKARMQFITEERNRESRERIAAMKEQAREIDRRAQRAERAAAAFGRREKF